VNRLRLGVSLLAAIICMPVAARPDVPQIKLSLICGSMTAMLAEIALNDGSFDRAGVHVEKYCFSGGAQAVQALVGRSVDVHIGSYELVLRQRSRGFNIKAYAQIYDGMSYELVVKTASPVRSVADLRGQALGITASGTLSDTALRLALADAHLNPDRDVQIIGTGAGTTMYAALETNRIAAGMMAEPTTTQLVADGKYRVLWSPTLAYPGNVLMAHAAWVDAHRDAMRKMLAVLRAVYARTKQNPSSAIAALQYDFPTIQPRIMLQAIQHQLTHVPPGLAVTRRGAAVVLDLELRSGDIKDPISYETAVDSNLIRSAR
jgi:NitT/TauT family transport system substrate-binding protein